MRATLRGYIVTIYAENTCFNAKVSINYTDVEGTPVLPILDDSTIFSATQFVNIRITEAKWEKPVL